MDREKRPETSTVVLLEAHDDLRASYANALRAGGFLVIAVADTDAVLLASRQRAPGVIVAGFDAGTRDARFVLCEQLKADTRLRSVPILLATANVVADDIRRAFEVSVLAIAVPLCDPAKLVSAVKGILAVDQSTTQPRTYLTSADTRS